MPPPGTGAASGLILLSLPFSWRHHDMETFSALRSCDVNVMLRQTFWLANRNRLFVLYTISLSSLCKHIWRHIKCPSDIFCRVCKIKHTSQLSMMQYMGLCVFSLRISFVMIERIYIPCLIIIVIKSEVWTIIHCWGLGHETMVSMSRYILMFLLLMTLVLAQKLNDVNVHQYLILRMRPSSLE